MSKSKKPRKKYTPKPIKAPGIRLAEKDAESLAFRTHMAARALDTEQGMEQFINIICKATVAMSNAGTLDIHAGRILRTASTMLEGCIKTGRITDKQEAFLQRTAGFIDDWLCEGRIRYADLQFASIAIKQIDCNISKRAIQ